MQSNDWAPAWLCPPQAFPTWELALRAKPGALAASIRVGGLAEIKAGRIQTILRTLRDEQEKELRGKPVLLSLEHLRQRSDDDIRAFLGRFNGVGCVDDDGGGGGDDDGRTSLRRSLGRSLCSQLLVEARSSLRRTLQARSTDDEQAQPRVVVGILTRLAILLLHERQPDLPRLQAKDNCVRAHVLPGSRRVPRGHARVADVQAARLGAAGACGPSSPGREGARLLAQVGRGAAPEGCWLTSTPARPSPLLVASPRRRSAPAVGCVFIGA